MKCLFVTSQSPDYISACLWDGLQEILGEENVIDAVGCDWLHKSSSEAVWKPSLHPEYYFICGSREGRIRHVGTDEEFDLLVLNACFNRDQSWAWARTWLPLLRAGGKVAYVEGWDAAWQIEPPQMPVDAVFRREILPSVNYPYACEHLSFAMPSRLFEPPDGERPFDVFFAGNPLSNHPLRPVRWQMLGRLFQTKAMHRSVVCTGNLGGFEPYWEFMKRSKLALVPPGADDCESVRCYEAAASGAIPILLCYPAYRRDPWFPPETCFECGLEGLADCIDHALSTDQTPRREALNAYAKKHHTTRARAEKLLEKTL